MNAARRDGNADGVKSFFWIVDLAINTILWLLLASLLSVLADIAAAQFLWRDDPIAGIETLVRYYLGQTSDPELSKRAADLAYWGWFGWTGWMPRRGRGRSVSYLPQASVQCCGPHSQARHAKYLWWRCTA